MQRGGKSGYLPPLDIVNFILLYSSKFFLFSFNPSLAAISDILIRLRDFLKKLKCMILCIIDILLQIIIDQGETDGVGKVGK